MTTLEAWLSFALIIVCLCLPASVALAHARGYARGQADEAEARKPRHLHANVVVITDPAQAERLKDAICGDPLCTFTSPYPHVHPGSGQSW